MKFSPKFFLFFLLFTSLVGSAQTFLRISFTRFGNTRSYEVFTNELLEYKLKGQIIYTTKKIVHMQDSLILFDDGTEIKLAQLKALRLRMHNHLVTTFQNAFLIAGIGFVTLNSVNNVITDSPPIFDERAAVISLALVATSFVIREFGIKRIRLSANKDLKIVSVDFQNLNTK